jgi:hypothetical protein
MYFPEGKAEILEMRRRGLKINLLLLRSLILNPDKMKAALLKTTFAIISLCFLLSACKNELGAKLEMNNLEIYYTDRVQQQEARNLGNFIETHSSSFDTSQAKKIQLDKKDGRYIFRVPVSTGEKPDSSLIPGFRMIGDLVSAEVFNHKPVDVDLCDDYFTSQLYIPQKK